MEKFQAENENTLKPPTLLLGEKTLKMKTSAGVANEILKFSDERRKLEVDNFLQRHIEIIALAFGTTADEVKEKVSLGVVVSKFLDCLEYVARAIVWKVEGVRNDNGNRGVMQ